MRSPDPPLTVIEGGRRGPAPAPLAAALEVAALGLGLTLVVALMARAPSWFWNLGPFQGLYAVAFAFFALALARLPRFETLPHVAWVVFAVAFATRALLVPLPPSLSGDLHRYVWEGRVLLAGGNPYRQSPLDPALAPLRDPAIWPQVNHPDLSTIYPPLAEAGFAAVAAVSPTVPAFKTWVALHDLALVVVLIAWLRRRGQSAARAIAYAWNPLVLVEYAGSGHNDPTAMVWLALAFALAESRPLLSAASLAAGALVKLAPLVALPFLLVRWPWRARLLALLLLAAGLGLFASQTRGTYSGLAAYWGRWRNNELAFDLLARVLGGYGAARTAALLVVAAAIGWAFRRGLAAPEGARAGFAAGLLVSPVLHPWYLGWRLMFEPLAVSPAWQLFSAMAILNYGLLATPEAGRAFHLSLGWRCVEYGVPLALAAGLALRARRLTRAQRT